MSIEKHVAPDSDARPRSKTFRVDILPVVGMETTSIILPFGLACFAGPVIKAVKIRTCYIPLYVMRKKRNGLRG